MAIQELYVIVDGTKEMIETEPPARVLSRPVSAFVEIETAWGESVSVGSELDTREGYEGMRRIGPLFAWDSSEVVSHTEKIQVRARMAVNELIALVEEHEGDEHAGQRCDDERLGVLAFVMHSMGVTTKAAPRVFEMLENYEHHHVHTAHELAHEIARQAGEGPGHDG